MEMLIALMIVALSEKDPAFKEKLRSVLAFYRENRELLVMLAQKSESCPPPEAQKNSPAIGGDDLRILDEFLKRV